MAAFPNAVHDVLVESIATNDKACKFDCCPLRLCARTPTEDGSFNRVARRGAEARRGLLDHAGRPAFVANNLDWPHSHTLFMLGRVDRDERQGTQVRPLSSAPPRLCARTPTEDGSINRVARRGAEARRGLLDPAGRPAFVANNLEWPHSHTLFMMSRSSRSRRTTRHVRSPAVLCASAPLRANPNAGRLVQPGSRAEAQRRRGGCSILPAVLRSWPTTWTGRIPKRCS